MEPKYLGLLAVIGLCVAGTAQAQTVPCYSAAQCAQVRMQAQQLQAAQEAAMDAQRQAAAQAQRAAVRAAAEQARQMAAARSQQAAQDAVAVDAAQRQAALYLAAAEAREKQAAQDRADAKARAQLDAENRAGAQLAAENSPDNRCKDRAIAGELLQTFNGFQGVQDLNLQAVDIEHLTTIKFDKEQHIYVCHGAFVLMNGVHRTGTLSTRINVAGNVIASWHVDPL